MSTTALAVMVLLGSSCVKVQASNPEKVEIAGEYGGTGIDIRGVKYTVDVEIIKEQETYRVVWTLPTGQKFIGIGLRNGKWLSVSWAGQQREGIILGITVYEIKKDGSLRGRWSMLGAKGVVRTETLQPRA